MADQPVIVNNALSRFELAVDGQVAFLEFTRDADSITLVHTEVPESLEGRGIGSAIVRGAIAYLREWRLSVVPQCPFVRSYLKRHPVDAESIGLNASTL